MMGAKYIVVATREDHSGEEIWDDYPWECASLKEARDRMAHWDNPDAIGVTIYKLVQERPRPRGMESNDG